MLPRQELIRVALDARCLNREHVRGMGKFAYELITRLDKYLPVAWELLSDRPDLPFHRPPAEGVAIHRFECRGYRFHSWEQWALPRRAKRLGADLLHCPGTRVPWWQPRPTIVTVHDALPWTQREPDWAAGRYRDRLLPAAFARSSAVITDSECSRIDLVKLWPWLGRKLHVVPLGVNDEYFRTEPAPLTPPLQAAGVREPYLLYLGGQIERKRLYWALRLLEVLADLPVQLVVCGLERGTEATVREQLSAGLRSRFHPVAFVAEADMPRLYQNAAAVLYPTLYEGFGFPVLEAQAVGTPILHSAVGSLTELIGPGSVVLPVMDLPEWESACRRLLRERTSGRTPDPEARAWAARFTWDACVSRYARIYASVAGRSAS